MASMSKEDFDTLQAANPTMRLGRVDVEDPDTKEILYTYVFRRLRRAELKRMQDFATAGQAGEALEFAVLCAAVVPAATADEKGMLAHLDLLPGAVAMMAAAVGKHSGSLSVLDAKK